MRNTKTMLGARIKELRKAGGLSQNELSEKVDIDSKHLSRIEVGRSYPSLDTLEKIAASLQVELKDLFEFMPRTTNKELLKDIKTMLQAADTEKLKMIFKMIRAIVR